MSRQGIHVQQGRNHDFSNSVGSGPTLRDPEDEMQKSDTAFANHVDNVSQRVGGGPSLMNTTEKSAPSSSEGNAYQHDEFLGTGPTASQVPPSELSTLHTLRTVIGLPAQPPLIDAHDSQPELWWPRIRVVMREPFAEFFGTFILVLFGDAGVAQVLLSAGQTTAPGGNGFGNYQSISWAWGIGTMLGIYIAGDSGGFLNPAITLCFCVYRKLPWRRLPIYVLAQFLGGFVAAGVVYINYINAINNVEGINIRTVPPAVNATAGIFCTYPQAFLSKASQFFSEFITATILMFVIFALKDDSNPGAMGKTGAGALFPLALFFLIFGLGACFGYETGYAINLARDFGPRLMSYAVGYGHEVWSAGEYYFWIPMVASFLGCLFGGFLYDAFIYTGPESPMNQPYFGLQSLVSGPYRRRTKIRSEKSVV